MLIALKIKVAMLGTALAAALMAAAFAPSVSLQLPGDALALTPGSFSYRVAGEFSKGGKPAVNPLRTIRLPRGFAIMKNQVTAAEYAVCVEDGGCPRVARPAGSQDAPVVGVNWHDAQAYARWLSVRTGITHRLPTDEEWSFAAAEKARDETPPLADPDDPAKAWIARYEAEASRERSKLTGPQPAGTFGTNSNGLVDLAGNVWEWTNTCFLRIALDGNAERVTNTNCGVRVVEGAHRAYMTDFIRDPRTGGCAAGVPPANLGFRLVVEQDESTRLARLLKRVGSTSRS
jgi:formylglycine-generating enzyme required for sulfatase activity